MSTAALSPSETYTNLPEGLTRRLLLEVGPVTLAGVASAPVVAFKLKLDTWLLLVAKTYSVLVVGGGGGNGFPPVPAPQPAKATVSASKVQIFVALRLGVTLIRIPSLSKFSYAPQTRGP